MSNEKFLYQKKIHNDFYQIK